MGPAPPACSGRVTTYSHSAAITSMSSSVVPTSSPVRNSPPSDWMKRPSARSSPSVFSVFGSPMITHLPPPRSTPAAAYLYVMPRARRIASTIASVSEA